MNNLKFEMIGDIAKLSRNDEHVLIKKIGEEISVSVSLDIPIEKQKEIFDYFMHMVKSSE